MDIIISNRSGKPIYEQITAQVKSAIMSGELQPGDPLPSMRALAKSLHISVITTQRAYEDLQRDGFIDTITGRGSFVAVQNKDIIQEEQLRNAEGHLQEAAEIGTRKVIKEHSTIGILVTSDGSITDIPREDYISAEERVVNELKEINKPFVIVLNTDDPYSEYTNSLAKKLEDKYQTPVIPTDCANLNIDDINNIFGKILYEFPIETVNITFPRWVDRLSNDHWLKKELFSEIKTAFKDVKILKQVDSCLATIQHTEIISSSIISEIRLGEGSVNISINLMEDLFYKILTEISGVTIANEGDLFATISEFSQTKKKYDKIAYAMDEVNAKGYGIVTPTMDELELEEPEMVKQGSKFGVKLKAKAPSIHMIKANIETEVSPIVGSEKQSEELVNYLLSEFESDPKKIWESNIFGKSLHELVNEGLQNKLSRMPEDAQEKLQETLEKIVNEGSGGLICIIL